MLPPANPVDMTFDLSMEKLATTLPEMIMKSGEVDAIVLHGIMHSGFMRKFSRTYVILSVASVL